jgi:hypothetical protein
LPLNLIINQFLSTGQFINLSKPVQNYRHRLIISPQAVSSPVNDGKLFRLASPSIQPAGLADINSLITATMHQQ